MNEIKQLTANNIGDFVLLDQDQKNAKGKKVYGIFRIKSYDNAHKTAWLVPNSKDWRKQSKTLTVGFKSIISPTKNK